MLREINKISEYYIPYASYTGYNIGAMPPDMVKRSNEIVKLDIGQGIIINTEYFAGWVHISTTSSNTIDISFSGILGANKRINDYQDRDAIHIYFDFIKMFEIFSTYEVENKYNIDIFKFISKLAIDYNTRYRYYGYTEVLFTPVDGTFDYYLAPVVSSDITTIVNGFGIGINAKQTWSNRLIIHDQYRVKTIQVNANITCHFMDNVFSINNLDLLKKNLKTNLKTKHIISPSKCNKINLGGEFDMLRNVYKSDYINYTAILKSTRSIVGSDIDWIKLHSNPVDVLDKTAYILVNSWIHISVINKNTLNMLGTVVLKFDPILPLLSTFSDLEFSLIIDIKKKLKTGKDIEIICMDNDFDPTVFSNTNIKSRIYGSGCLSFDTTTDNNFFADNPYELLRLSNAIDDGTFSLSCCDMSCIYTIKSNSYDIFRSSKIDILNYTFNVNMQYYTNVFEHMYDSLKKNFRVYYLNNIQTLPYYIN